MIGSSTPPAGAATVPSPNGSPSGDWVDGAGRLHTVFSQKAFGGEPDRVRVARHLAGTVDLDASYAGGGVRDLAVANPYPPTGAACSADLQLEGRLTETGITSDGTVVVAWLVTGGQRETATYPDGTATSVCEYDHADDRIVIDRYDVAGARLSRVDRPLPANSWCSTGYGGRSWYYETSYWAPEGPQDSCGEVEYPSIRVLANGVVAVPTFGLWQYERTQPVGTSSVVFISAASGTTLSIVAMPQNREVGRGVEAVGSSGAVFDTYDWTQANGGASAAQGPSYVVSGWTSTTTRPMSADFSCSLWPGTDTSTFRTCTASGTIAVTGFDASGNQTWSRTLPAAQGAQAAGQQADGRISLVASGCEPAGATCHWGDRLAIRFAPTGTIERYTLASFSDPTTGTGEYYFHHPVALSGGRLAVTGSRRPSGPSQARWTVETRLLVLGNALPRANAGADKTVSPSQAFTLDGSTSSDDGGTGNLAFQWVQVAGPATTIEDPRVARTAATAPGQATTLIYRVTVTDQAGQTSSDEVSVTVRSPK